MICHNNFKSYFTNFTNNFKSYFTNFLNYIYIINNKFIN